MEKKEQTQLSSQEKSMLDMMKEDMLHHRFMVARNIDRSKRTPEMQRMIDEAKAQMHKK